MLFVGRSSSGMFSNLVKNGRLGNVRSSKAQKPVMQVVMSHSPVLRRAHDHKNPYTQTVLLFIY